MKHTIDHDLDMETARKATHEAFDNYAQRFSEYSPTANWVTEDKAEVGFKAKGISLNGSIELRPGAIDLELDVPFLFRPFRKMALSVIEEEIRERIQKAKG
jgi:hypothetical protein